jgi:hypothetical protein
VRNGSAKNFAVTGRTSTNALEEVFDDNNVTIIIALL